MAVAASISQILSGINMAGFQHQKKYKIRSVCDGTVIFFIFILTIQHFFTNML
jgi:hypothetical protein